MIETKEYIVDGKPFTVSIDKEEQFLKDNQRAVLKVDVPGKQERSTSGGVVEAATTVTPTVEQNQETDLSQNNQQVNTELPSEDGSLESPETSEQPLKFEASDELLNKLLNLGKLNSNSNLDSTNTKYDYSTTDWVPKYHKDQALDPTVPYVPGYVHPATTTNLPSHDMDYYGVGDRDVPLNLDIDANGNLIEEKGFSLRDVKEGIKEKERQSTIMPMDMTRRGFDALSVPPGMDFTWETGAPPKTKEEIEIQAIANKINNRNHKKVKQKHWDDILRIWKKDEVNEKDMFANLPISSKWKEDPDYQGILNELNNNKIVKYTQSHVFRTDLGSGHYYTVKYARLNENGTIDVYSTYCGDSREGQLEEGEDLNKDNFRFGENISIEDFLEGKMGFKEVEGDYTGKIEDFKQLQYLEKTIRETDNIIKGANNPSVYDNLTEVEILEKHNSLNYQRPESYYQDVLEEDLEILTDEEADFSFVDLETFNAKRNNELAIKFNENFQSIATEKMLNVRKEQQVIIKNHESTLLKNPSLTAIKEEYEKFLNEFWTSGKGFELSKSYEKQWIEFQQTNEYRNLSDKEIIEKYNNLTKKFEEHATELENSEGEEFINRYNEQYMYLAQQIPEIAELENKAVTELEKL